MNKFFLFLVSLLVGMGLFVWIAQTIGWQEIKKAFLMFEGWQGIIIFILTLLMMIASAKRWQEILKGGGTKLPFFHLLRLYLAGFSVMYFVPIVFFGGELVRSYVLREKDSVPWDKSMASVIIDRILEWTTNLAVILAGSLIFLLLIGLPPAKLLVIFGGTLFLLTLGIAFFYFKSFKRESMISFFLRNNGQPHEVEKEIFHFFRHSKAYLWKSLFFSFSRAVIMYCRAWLLMVFLGKSIGLLPAVSVLGFTYLALMIPIPAAFGSHEAIQAFGFNSLGLGVSNAPAFTMIIRGAEIIVALIGIAVLVRFWTVLIKKI